MIDAKKHLSGQVGLGGSENAHRKTLERGEIVPAVLASEDIFASVPISRMSAKIIWIFWKSVVT